MIVAIIAGGSGTRLWPLSTPEFPKHLLTVGGSDKSLLQSTYDRAKKIGTEVYVVSEISHIQAVKDQLPELSDDHFIVEPARRGTANCIIMALAHIAKNHDANEPIAFLHADHYIRDTAGFAHSFRTAERMAQEQGKIVLVGVEPDYPATGFGYIKKDGLVDETAFVHNVDSFKEKPDFETAQAYLKSGDYLWNCGYFVGSVATFKNKMETYAPDLLESYNKLSSAATDELQDTYLSLESDAIDYALIEKVQDLLVVPADFDWMDLGSFADIAKVAQSDSNGNFKAGDVEIEDVKNSYIENQDATKPVAVIGLDNVVVVNTPDGILVTRKDLSQKVGDIAKRINARGEK